jgi:hypothetical protein
MAFRREVRTMTLQDYYAIPEDGPRLEVSDGVVYDMAAAPSPKHPIAEGDLVGGRIGRLARLHDDFTGRP